MSALSDLIGVLLPGGLAIGLVTLFQGLKSWREGRTTREETAIKRWQRLAARADQQKEIAEQDEAYAIVVAEYWRTCYAELEFAVRSQTNMEIPARPQMPVKRMRSAANGGTTRRRPRQAELDDVD